MEENLTIDETLLEEPDSSVITEYEQTVIQRLDSIDITLKHQYTLGLFVTGCVTAVFVRIQL